MAYNYWKGGSGSYDVAGNWSAGRVPGANGNEDDVVINTTNAVVSLNDGLYASVNSLILSAGDVLVIGNQSTLSIGDGGINGGTIDASAEVDIDAGSAGFTNDGLIEASQGLRLVGAVTNAGTITADGYYGLAFANGDTGLTLNGGGTLTLRAATMYVANNSSDLFENVDNTIQGSGSFTGVMQNDAKGVLDADVGGGTLAVTSFGTVTNKGLMEAGDDSSSHGGTLAIATKVVNTGGTVAGTQHGIVTDSAELDGGTVVAGDSSSVTLSGPVTGAALTAAGDGLLTATGSLSACTVTASGTGATVAVGGTVTGGTLRSLGGGTLSFQGAVLVGTSTASPLAIQGTATVGDLATGAANEVTLAGDIQNTGTVAVTASQNGADLVVRGGLALSGGGTVTLGDGAGDGLIAAARGTALVNEDNLIQGNGDLGGGRMQLVNEGIVDATGGSPLFVFLDAGAGSSNTGTLEATGGGELQFVSGQLDNSAGTIDAGAGSTVDFGRSFVLANSGVANGTLTGGTFAVEAGGLMVLTGGPIADDEATIRLSGAGAVLQSAGAGATTTLEQSLTTIGGTLSLASRDYTTANALALNGTLTLAGGTLTAGLITGSAGSTLAGYGAVAASVTTSGNVGSSALGQLTLTGASDRLSGAVGGRVVFGAGLDVLAAGASLSGISLVEGATLKIGTTLAASGIFALISGTLALGGYTFTLNGNGSLAGTVQGVCGKLIVGATDTVAGLQIGASALLRDNGTVDQTGAVTLGDGSGGAAQITVAGMWKLDGDVGIAAGAAAAVVNLGGGTLVKTAGGTTRSVVSPNIVNNSGTAGVVEAGTGRLELGGTLSGALTLRADAGTTLILDRAAGAGAAFAFAGAGATLQLNDAPDFSGSIAGLAAGESLDLRSIAFGSDSLSYSGTSGAGTLTVSNGASAAHLALLGSYAQGSFYLGADGHGGSLVTYG